MKTKLSLHLFLLFVLLISTNNFLLAQNQTFNNTAINLTGTSTIQSNGNPGTSGQVLQSQGAGALPIWVTPSSGGGNLGQSAITVLGTGTLALDSTTGITYSLVPGLTQTITVPSNALLYIESGGGIQMNDSTNDWVSAGVAFYIDNALVNGSEREISCFSPFGWNPPDNGGYPIFTPRNNWAISIIRILAAGSHTIEVRSKITSTSLYMTHINDIPPYTRPVILVSNNSAPRQGSLTVIVLKQ